MGSTSSPATELRHAAGSRPATQGTSNFVEVTLRTLSLGLALALTACTGGDAKDEEDVPTDDCVTDATDTDVTDVYCGGGSEPTEANDGQLVTANVDGPEGLQRLSASFVTGAYDNNPDGGIGWAVIAQFSGPTHALSLNFAGDPVLGSYALGNDDSPNFAVYTTTEFGLIHAGMVSTGGSAKLTAWALDVEQPPEASGGRWYRGSGTYAVTVVSGAPEPITVDLQGRFDDVRFTASADF